MRSANIVKKLEKEGYNIVYKKWEYWDGIPHVQLNGFEFAIVEYTGTNGWLGCNLNFIYNQVKEALYIAKKNNPILLKKIKEAPGQEWFYSRYLILNMQDYFQYKKDKYPFDNYYNVLERLKNEVK